MEDEHSGTTPRRPPARSGGRGRPARVNRDIIVAAALELGNQPLTMQAVAAQLGVDRKTLSYHVAGLDELVSLVTLATLSSQLERLSLPDGDWKSAVRVFAGAVREVLLDKGSLSLGITHLPGSGLLRPADALAARLLAAGFDPAVTGRFLTLLLRVVFADVRDTLLEQKHGQHPSVQRLDRAMDQVAPLDVPALRQVGEAVQSSQQEQHDFEVEILIAGLQSRLR